jgi:hypothetical protein
MAELSEDAKAILGALPKDGSMVGNLSLMRKLAMPPERFFEAKQELDNEALIVYGKGRGGSTGLAKPTIAPPERATTGVRDEYDLYGPLKKYFDDFWKPNYKAPDLYISKITGPPKDHKRKSGLWSRPDVSVLTVSAYDFIPERVLELTTVEAKKYADIGTRAVFETVSHSKFGHQAFLAFEWLDDVDMDDSSNEDVVEVFKESRRFGIGIMQMKMKEDKTWEIDIVLDSIRHDPEPADCNRFIEQNFAEYHKQIRSAIGR